MNPKCPIHADFDPFSDEFLADPFPIMAANEEPIFYAPSIDYYVVTRYEDIEAIFLDHETYSAAAAQLPLVALDPAAVQILREDGYKPQPSMVSLDPPAHRRLRNPTVRAFTPRRVREMEPKIRKIVAQLLDEIDPSQPFDIVSALAFPLPATVVFELLGIPETHWGQLKEWCGDRASLTFGRPEPAEQVENARGLVAYRSFLREFVAERNSEDKATRTDDFTTALLAIHDEDPEKLELGEIVSILFSLTLAGHETTHYLIGNLLRNLLADRELWQSLVDDPSLIPNAVNEMLRYDTSVAVWRRMTTKPTTLGGVELPEGAKLYLWLAAAGRDTTLFPEPDKFDIHRENATSTLAFGKGVHYCLGEALGKLEARIALEGVLTRFPNLQLVEDQTLTFPTNIAFRGPKALWVHLEQVIQRNGLPEPEGLAGPLAEPV
ncbi:MAG: cytochrome P450 [Chloroflexota bacterium]